MCIIYLVYYVQVHKGHGKAVRQMAKEKKKNQLNSRSVIVIVLCFVLLLYMGIRFVKAQSEINAKEAQLTELESIYESQIAENEDLKAAIKDGDKKELAEEYARKKGYVMPDERVYVDITPGSEE